MLMDCGNCGNLALAVLSFRSFGIGNQHGHWTHCMLLLMKLGFLQRGLIESWLPMGSPRRSWIIPYESIWCSCRREKARNRVGALYVTCQLFKIYSKLGTVHLCPSVIRSIETARIFDFEEFPRRDKVTYMYYTGRLEVFNENFPAVECIMTILIYKNLVKGYFAHKSKVVVLSKQDPFPKLNGKPVNS
ncbi:hypothetical protein V6N11_066387 [Hibiscus sabdariffa]|uniref:Uncharacterized protein n=2 Tax=Hibiscus sabdariffa TaxID=183260 RepID=A0ABR2B821_9ROSI